MARRPAYGVRPSTFHILNFFSRTAEGIYSKLGTHFPYDVLTKGCYFLSQSKIQYGCLGLWLVDTFWTSSQEWLKVSTPNLPQIFPMRSRPSVVTFQVNLKSNMFRPGLWFADTFWTSSQEQLKGSTPNLPQMFLMRFRLSDKDHLWQVWCRSLQPFLRRSSKCVSQSEARVAILDFEST